MRLGLSKDMISLVDLMQCGLLRECEVDNTLQRDDATGV